MVQGVVIEDGVIIDINPATGAVVGRVRVSTVEDVDAAVERARQAQVAWALTPLEDRVGFLQMACAKLAEASATCDDGVARTLPQLITAEMGKVLAEAEEEVEGAVSKEEFLALVAAANAPEAAPAIDGGPRAEIVRDAHGVIAVLAPWNFPADEILLLALPALAAGNSVVVKPSEVTPLTGKCVLEALQSVLPPGVAELVQGDGAVGERLVSHPAVSMVAMTGSSATGRRIMNACSDTLKRVVLELGGKDPMIVYADADMDKAADDAVKWSFYNCGQVCCGIERIYVEEPAKAQFEAKVLEKAAAWVAGDGGADPEAKLGPMVSSMQRDIVRQHVDQAIAGGARQLLEGTVRGPDAGFFFPSNCPHRPTARYADHEGGDIRPGGRDRHVRRQ